MRKPIREQWLYCEDTPATKAATETAYRAVYQSVYDRLIAKKPNGYPEITVQDHEDYARAWAEDYAHEALWSETGAPLNHIRIAEKAYDESLLGWTAKRLVTRRWRPA